MGSVGLEPIEPMKNAYRLFRRGNVFWCQNNQTGKQQSLGTKDRATGLRFLHAKNEAERQPQVCMQMARAYLASSDPEATKRTWAQVMDAMGKCKQGTTLERWTFVVRDPAFDMIRDLPVLETRADHILKVLDIGTVSTNVWVANS